MMSLEPELTARVLSGQKTVELRRRRVCFKPGDRVWFYSKVPTGQVEAVAIVKNVVEGAPSELWARFKNRIGITRAEFDRYLGNCAVASGIVLGEVTKLDRRLDLGAMRSAVDSFQPPQFYRRLRHGSVELSMCLAALRDG